MDAKGRRLHLQKPAIKFCSEPDDLLQSLIFSFSNIYFNIIFPSTQDLPSNFFPS
jgi:hypothetical protein